jgi:predicted nucleic acid-binding Zn ribbon protein
VVAPGAERLVDHDLDRGLVADREQLLGNGFGGGEETGPQTSRGDDSAADLHESDDILLRPMPTYVYKFVDTGETIEVQQGFHDDNLTEIAHPDSGEVLPVKKVFTPVGVTFKGSGFFKTDNRGKKSATSTTSTSKDSSSSSDTSSSSSSEASTSSSPKKADTSGSSSSGSSSSAGS